MSTEDNIEHNFSDNDGNDSEDSREFFSDEDKYLEYKDISEKEKIEKIDSNAMDKVYFIYDDLNRWANDNGFMFFNKSGYCSFHLHEFLKMHFKD